MKQSAQWIDSEGPRRLVAMAFTRLSFLKFLMRYPIFLLAFGPPILRPPTKYAGFDTSQAHFDLWSVFQVAWLALIALRAIYRLINVPSIFIPWQVRSILKYPLYLGLLFLASIAYSPGRVISAEYSLLYFLDFICIVEFLADVYRDPPNWMQCLFHLRLIFLLLFAVILLILPFKLNFVAGYAPGVGLRIIGGAVANMGVICPFIAIISAYSFLHSLESKARSIRFFLVGLAGTVVSQTRGVEISLLVVLLILAIQLPRTSRRTTYIFCSGFVALMLLAAAVVGAVGGERIWSKFNRGQDTEGILTLSGRTGVWVSLVQYSLSHPQGMGYIAGIRTFHGGIFAENLHASLSKGGGIDSAYLETLADAGWLALGFYMIMIVKTFALGLRFAKKHTFEGRIQYGAFRHPLRCALLLLLYCVVEQMEGPDFVLPLRQAFYVQNIIIAIILGASASMLFAARAGYNSGRE